MDRGKRTRKRGARTAEARQTAPIRKGRTAGLGIGAGALLTVSANTFGLAPNAHADIFDSIVSSIDSAISTVVNDAESSVNGFVTDLELLSLAGAGSGGLPVEDSSIGVNVLPDNYPTVEVAAGSGPTVPVVLDTGSDALVLPVQDVPQGPALWLAEFNQFDHVTGGYFGANGGITFKGVELEVPSVTLGEPSSGEVTTGNTEVIAVLSATNDQTGNPETLAQYFGQPIAGVVGVGPNETNDLAYDDALGTVHPLAQQLLVTDALPSGLKDGEFLQLDDTAGTGTLGFGPSQNFIDTATTSSGAPITPVMVQIGNNTEKEVDAVFDSGGGPGSVPLSANGGATSIANGTEISVYNLDGKLLYEYQAGNPDAGTPALISDAKDQTGPDDIPGTNTPLPEMNTGIAPFEYAGAGAGSPDPLTDGVYISNSGDGSIIVPTAPETTGGGDGGTGTTNPNIVATISGVSDGTGTHIAVSPVGPEAGDIYVVGPFDPGDLSVIDPTTNTVVHTIDVGIYPTTLAVSPVGPEAGDIYVGNYGNIYGDDTLSVIDPSTNTVVHTIDFGAGTSDPVEVAVSPVGPEAGDIDVINPDADTLEVIDPSTYSVLHTVALGPYPSALTVSPTGPEAGDIYVADSGNGIGDSTVSVIDPATNTVVHTIDVGTYSSGLAVSPTGPEAGDVYVINNNFDGLVRVIDPSTNTVVHTIDAPLIPHDVAVSPTGSTAGDIYVTGGDTAECEAICLAVIDPSDNTVVDTYTIDSQVGGPSAVTISPTGPEAGDIYATDESNLLVIEP